jgi:hypothetical protein
LSILASASSIALVVDSGGREQRRAGSSSILAGASGIARARCRFVPDGR